jgi:hypothetical protein
MAKPKIRIFSGAWICYTEGIALRPPICAVGDSPQSAYAEWHRIATMGSLGR